MQQIIGSTVSENLKKFISNLPEDKQHYTLYLKTLARAANKIADQICYPDSTEIDPEKLFSYADIRMNALEMRAKRHGEDAPKYMQNNARKPRSSASKTNNDASSINSSFIDSSHQRNISSLSQVTSLINRLNKSNYSKVNIDTIVEMLENVQKTKEDIISAIDTYEQTLKKEVENKLTKYMNLIS